MQKNSRLKRLPPYVFSLINDVRQQVLAAGHDIIEFGMGNPDQATPPHILQAMLAAADVGENHRYSDAQGILPLRQAISDWYQQRYAVALDPQTETLVTLGSKEGLAQLALTLVDSGDTVITTMPCYPIHQYGFVIAGAEVVGVPLNTPTQLLADIERALEQQRDTVKLLVLNFPNNPTGACVDLAFFEQVVALAKHYGILVVHDFAYAEITFDGYQAPSILQVPGAKALAVETYSLSKTYNMPGWRVGFMCGNSAVIAAVNRIKSYATYGMFAPLEYGAIAALTGPQDCVTEICQRYQQRRDVLCAGLQAIGWSVTKPQAGMFVWAEIPSSFRHLGSLEFAQQLIQHAHVAVAPGCGFGEAGDQFVRFALIQDEQPTTIALQRLHTFLTAEHPQRELADSARMA